MRASRVGYAAAAAVGGSVEGLWVVQNSAISVRPARSRAADPDGTVVRHGSDEMASATWWRPGRAPSEVGQVGVRAVAVPCRHLDGVASAVVVTTSHMGANASWLNPLLLR